MFWLGIVSDFIFFKIATTVGGNDDKKFQVSHFLAFINLTVLMSLLSLVYISELIPHITSPIFIVFIQLFRFFFVVIFCIKIKNFSLNHALIAAFLAESIVFSTRVIGSGFYLLVISFNLDINPNIFIIPLNLIVGLFALVGHKQWVILFEAIYRSVKMKAILFTIMIFLYAGPIFIMPIMNAIDDNETVIEVTILLLVAVILSLMITLIITAIRTTAKKEVMQKEAESQVLKFYADEMERQYATIRSFRHDYANIMLTFKQLMDNDDMVGLKKFYYENMDSLVIKQVADSAVKDVARLKIPEIKSLILSKIQLANVPVFYESQKDIDHVPIDMIDFLRMIGIVLDNAIEEVETLGTGEVRVGFDVNEDSVIFICKNDCRVDMPAIYELRTDGFSTKGNGRGIGLSNLDELVGKYEHIFLETTIENGYFIQRLSMEFTS